MYLAQYMASVYSLQQKLWSRNLVSRGGKHIPNTADVLSCHITGRFVFLVIVERPTVIRHLDATILALRRPEQRSVHTVAGNRITCGQERRPGGRAFIVAD